MLAWAIVKGGMRNGMDYGMEYGMEYGMVLWGCKNRAMTCLEIFRRLGDTLLCKESS